MEVNVDCAKIQGILRAVLEKTGDFRRIKYKGGLDNEEKLFEIVNSLRDYLVSKNYLIDGHSNSKYNQELQNITALLIVNTEFKNKDNGELLQRKEFLHYMKVIPIISKFVLANIIIELDLTNYYCSIISILPFTLTEELLSEVIGCMKQCEPTKALQYTNTFLTTIIQILAILDTENNRESIDIVHQLSDIASAMLKLISGINSDWAPKWTKAQINCHMGHTILCLLKLLRSCPLYTSSFSKLTDDLILVLVTILKNVTLHVFCAWAEVKYEFDQPLQLAIAGEAYMVMEYLQKYKPAKELIQMLVNFARKPKTIHEIILESDVATMIATINKCDDNQKIWFKAFMNTNVLQNEESVRCLEKWAELCTQDDVIRLLNKHVYHKDIRIKELVLKCAKSLNIEELALVTSRYLRESNSNNLETESFKNQLALLLNKTQSDSDIDENFIKDIYLLLLQNAEFVVTTLFTKCSNKSACTYYLKNAFKNIKTTIEIQNLSKIAFIKVFKSNPPMLENIPCYTELLNTLLDLRYFEDLHNFQDKIILCEIFLPYLHQCLADNDFKMLSQALQLLNQISITHTLRQDILPVFSLLTNILEKSRFQFFTFSSTNQDVIQETIHFIMKYVSGSSNILYEDYFCSREINNRLNKFYFTILYKDSEKNHLLTYLYPKYSVDGNTEILAELIKILPTCVTTEWLLITKELESQCGYQRTLLLLEDTFILLCQIAKSQIEATKMQVTDGLQFCLQQYGIVIKDILKGDNRSLAEDIMLTKSVCNVLQHIPKDIRDQEGLQLVNELSQQSLHSLKNDKDFVMLLVAIKDSSITQVIAKKMLL